jgi:putative transposase
MFRGFLEYKALKKGKYFIKIDKYYPSSKTCHSCSYINKNVVLGIQEWTCPNCSVHHDRDLNAAINIQKEAYRLALL